MRSHGADVVALQEADGPSAWSGKIDHVARLAALAGYPSTFRGDHNRFGSAAAPLASGTALLTRGELGETGSHAFGTSWRDTKGFVVGRVPVPEWGFDVDVISVHLDFLAPTRRLDQIERLAEVLDARPWRPRILLGDLNCCGAIDPEVHDRIEAILGLHTHEPEGGEATFPSRRPRLRLDWIFASPELRFVHYRTHSRPLSDHLGVVADLVPA
jgi:endonuclease/exonuclease/phosphatase family metal-dependent hydrolase